MRVSRSRTSGSTLLRLGGHAMFVGAPIVIGVAMVSLALAYGNSTQLGLGIALLGVGLGIESIRNLYVRRAAGAERHPGGTAASQGPGRSRHTVPVMESVVRALPERPSVCLAMIVKDEAHCIAECLASVRDHISHWVICDTGSSDNTAEVVREALEGIPGELHRHPWVNFAHNRNAALELARDRADHVLVIDADDRLVCDAGVEPFAGLTAQCYWVEIVDGGTHYSQAQLVHRALKCRFTGAVYEVLQVDGAHSAEVLRGCRIEHGHHGARSRDPLVHLRDARILEAEVAREPDNPRHVLYLAQSYRDARLPEKALEAYLKRAEMGGWDQEVFFALYSAARLRHSMGQPWETVLHAYLAAYQNRPTRLEPLLHIARHHRERGEYALGYMFSRPVVDSPFPTDALFVERGVYEYELPLEYGICCYWTGRHREAVRVNDAILARPGVPVEFREAAERNRQFSIDVLAEAV